MSDSPRFAVLGFGNMGRALVRGVLKAGLTPPENVTVTARTPARLSAAATEFGVQTTSNNRCGARRRPSQRMASSNLRVLSVPGV